MVETKLVKVGSCVGIDAQGFPQGSMVLVRFPPDAKCVCKVSKFGKGGKTAVVIIPKTILKALYANGGETVNATIEAWGPKTETPLNVATPPSQPAPP